MHYNENFYELVEQCRPLIKEVSVSEVEHILKNKTNYTLIDVRQGSEWIRGRIQSAIHLSLDTLESKINNIIPDTNSQLIIYCAAGYRSVIATFNLQKMGYSNVASMAGGLSEWVSSGNKIII